MTVPWIILFACLCVSVLLNLVLYNRLLGASGGRSDQPTVTDWKTLATGTSGDIEIEKGFLSVMQDQYTLFCRKQHDYGRTNIAVGGTHGLVVRLGDKTSRLFNLLGIGKAAAARGVNAPAVAEAREETFIDVGNYGTIGVMVERGLWPLVSPEEVWVVPQESEL